MTGLTVRVINNVRKRMEVKPKFYDTFKGEGFPAEFSYNQKARGALTLTLSCSLPASVRGINQDQRARGGASWQSRLEPSARRCPRPCAAWVAIRGPG